MNKNVENIIKAYATITNNHDKADIVNKLSKSEVFNEIANNNPVYLYEGYPSNLLEIAEELKQQAHCPAEIHKITESSIVQYNKTKRAKASAPMLLKSPVVVTAAEIAARPRPLTLGLRTNTATPKRLPHFTEESITAKVGNTLDTDISSVLIKKEVAKKTKHSKKKTPS